MTLHPHAIRKTRDGPAFPVFIRNIVLAGATLAAAFSTPSARADFSSLGEALPARLSGEAVVEHTGYTLSYREEFEQAAWVEYLLTAEHLGGDEERSGDFRIDPAVQTGSATPADYRNSGFDRGHLAPAADMKWSETAMSESFFMSNMSPQTPEFNRGIWKQLESRVRVWAKGNGALFVVSGPVLERGLPVIGNNRVAVPRLFYKVILDDRGPEYKGIGFILPNEAVTKPIDMFAVTIDSVESATGIDFFPGLPDSLERALEGTIEPALWALTGPVVRVAAAAEIPGTAGRNAEVPGGGTTGGVPGAVGICAVAALAAGAGYLGYRRRKRR